MPLQQIIVSSPTLKDVEDVGTRSKEVKVQESVYSPSPILSMERCASAASVLSMNYDICRICHCEGDNEVPLIAPCYCSGSLRYVHQACLQQWIKSSDTKCCELCKFQFIMQSKIKPFSEWEKLAMSPVERRKLLCSVTFHAVALTCVVWSLYVLIDRTTEEVRAGMLEWPFWTKLVVVAIGFTGGLVFMYIQCKMYVQLCKRWKAFNRVIFVQNAPEKPPPPKDIIGVKLPPQPTRVSLGSENSEGSRGNGRRSSNVVAAAGGEESVDLLAGTDQPVRLEPSADEHPLSYGDIAMTIGNSDNNGDVHSTSVALVSGQSWAPDLQAAPQQLPLSPPPYSATFPEV